MILSQKQNIIIKHIEGMSNRGIARELHLSKDTVNKYVAEYGQQKADLLRRDPTADPSELIQTLVVQNIILKTEDQKK